MAELESAFAGFPRGVVGRVFVPAQTHVQLIDQLRTALPPIDRIAFQRAYGLAMELFTGAYRPGGRVFLAHLIGTASIAAVFDSRNEIALAGLLHSAYSHGDFGGGLFGETETKRAQVREVVGAATEDRIHRYSGLRWDAESIAEQVDGAPGADPVHRDVLLLALANSAEDYTDAVGLPGDSAERREHIRRCGSLEVELAKRLGHVALADAHAHLQSLALRSGDSFDRESMIHPPRRSIYLRGPLGSFIVPPASHRMRPAASARRLLTRYSFRRLRRRLARALFLRG